MRAICYCRMCQKASGQPFMGLTGGKAEHLRWTRGTPSIFKSSNMAERGFCPQCGTPLTYGSQERRISVTINSLDDPEAVPPTQQVRHRRQGSAWLDELPQLPSQRTDEWLTDNAAHWSTISAAASRYGEKR